MSKTKVIIILAIVAILVVGVAAVQRVRMRYVGKAFGISEVDAFPVYSGAEFAGTLSGATGGVTGIWKINKTPGEIASWYADELKKQEWVVKNNDAYLIEAEKSGMMLRVEITQEESGEPTQIVAGFSSGNN